MTLGQFLKNIWKQLDNARKKTSFIQDEVKRIYKPKVKFDESRIESISAYNKPKLH